MKKVLIVFVVACLISFSSPSTSYAAWWNPFSWKIFSRSTESSRVEKKEQPSVPKEGAANPEAKKPDSKVKDSNEKTRSSNSVKKAAPVNGEVVAPAPKKVEKIEISFVDPLILVNSVDRTLKVSGRGFKSGTLIKLNDYTLETAVITSELMQATISRGFPPGQYSLQIKSSDGQQLVYREKITVLPVVPGESMPTAPAYQAPVQPSYNHQSPTIQVPSPSNTNPVPPAVATSVEPASDISIYLKSSVDRNYAGSFEGSDWTLKQRTYLIKASGEDFRFDAYSFDGDSQYERGFANGNSLWRDVNVGSGTSLTLASCAGLNKLFQESQDRYYPYYCAQWGYSYIDWKGEKRSTMPIISAGNEYTLFAHYGSELKYLRLVGLTSGKIVERYF